MSLAVLGLFRLLSPVFKPTRHFLPPQALRSLAPRMALPAATPVTPVTPKPLRVTRIVDDTTPRNAAGRMVISGNMREVCAELDRLVALESAALNRKT
jgi:hypothetical protein